MKQNDKRRKRIGIFGGTRFIGYHLVWALYKEGYDIAIFNRGITPLAGPLPPNIKWVYGDRNNPKDLQLFFRNRFDAVIDLSGYSLRHVEPIVHNYRHYIKHYIFCSTSSVYSLPLPLQFKESCPRTKVSNTYGGNKALVEDMLLRLYNRTKWPITILRPQAVFGPYDAYHASYIFYRLLNSIPILLGHRRNVKVNFLYVNDLVNVFLLAMNNPKSYGKAYNVAGDDAISQKEFIELCGKISKCEPKISIIDEKKYKGADIGVHWHDCDMVPNNSKIKGDLKLGFTPLKAALRETYEWLIKHPKQSRFRLSLEDRFILRNLHIPKWVNVYRKLTNWIAIKLNLLLLYFRLIFIFLLFNKMKNFIKN